MGDVHLAGTGFLISTGSMFIIKFPLIFSLQNLACSQVPVNKWKKRTKLSTHILNTISLSF